MLLDFDLEQIIFPLQEWYGENKRSLRWRENPKAYYVWISEIMLQQTRVEAVKHYFDRFVDELPDVQALAECDEERLLKLWEGLGYYNRARNLKEAAGTIVCQYNGELPNDYEHLLSLKGIGSYTAGAIASIAYGQPVCAVDGNVLRVIARVSGDDSDITKMTTKQMVEKQLGNLIAEHAKKGLMPGIFNQALMELGALVCVPNKEPLCEKCPWKDFCVAKKEGTWSKLPVKTPKKKRRMEEKTVLVIRMEESVAIRKRGTKGLLGGLYEIPNLEGHLSSKEVLQVLKAEGFLAIRIKKLPQAKHIFSHVEWDMIGYMILVEENRALREQVDYLFVEVKELEEQYAIPSAFEAYRKVIYETLA